QPTACGICLSTRITPIATSIPLMTALGKKRPRAPSRSTPKAIWMPPQSTVEQEPAVADVLDRGEDDDEQARRGAAHAGVRAAQPGDEEAAHHAGDDAGDGRRA